MTEPDWTPVPAPVSDILNQPRWCSACEIHRTTEKQPMCPSCLDVEVRGR